MKKLDNHPWCGHSVVMNKTKQEWQNVDYIYGLFSDQKKMAKRRYREFVEQGIPQGKRSNLFGSGLLRSIGGWTALRGLWKAGIRVIENEEVIKKILKHLGLWEMKSRPLQDPRFVN